MSRVNLPDSFSAKVLYGTEVEKDEAGCFVELDSPYAEMAVQAHSGVIVIPAEAPAV